MESKDSRGRRVIAEGGEGLSRGEDGHPLPPAGYAAV